MLDFAALLTRRIKALSATLSVVAGQISALAAYPFVPLGPAQGCLDILIAQDDALAAFPREKGPPPIHKGRALFFGAAEQAQMHAQPR